MSASLLTNVDAKALRTTKFPPHFNVRVDMHKVNVPVIKKWAADQIAKILQNDDDDVVPELVFNALESERYVCISIVDTRPHANVCIARNQGIADQHDGLSRQGCSKVLCQAMVAVHKRSGESTWCTQGPA